MYDYNEICKIASNLNCKTALNEPMSKHTSFKIGGNADVFIYVNDKSALKILLKTILERNIPYFVLGNGSNVLVTDRGIRGVVLKLDGEFCSINLTDDGTIECGSGVPLTRLCNFALQKSLTGLEFAYGIPGTVGGAAFMNAGAYGGEMKDVLVCCEHINGECHTEKIFCDKLELGYRTSVYSAKNDIITKVCVKLKPGDPLHIKAAMDEFMQRRKEKQPLEYPSAGSVFKRPVGNFAGTLIESCGLKGKKIGGAMVSEKHAGFIVNEGKATCMDVLNLIDHIKATVFEKSNIVLECEVKTVGEI